jgi:hypothetical protein
MHRRFIFGPANIAKPLAKLKEEKQALQQTPELETAFQTLNEALCTALILAYPQPGGRFIIGTNMSNVLDPKLIHSHSIM